MNSDFRLRAREFEGQSIVRDDRHTFRRNQSDLAHIDRGV
jgi:hypothetical protein